MLALEQYFTSKPKSSHQIQTIEFKYKGQNFQFKTDSGVFSKNKFDYGSQVLLDSILSTWLPGTNDQVLELGSGYGPLLIILAKQFPLIQFTGLEINSRAFDLAKENSLLNHCSNICWRLSDVSQAELAQAYDLVLTNPPIRAGKAVIQSFVRAAFSSLNKDGKLYLVIQKKQGAPSMKTYMEQVFGNVERLQQDKGYWILMSYKS